MVVPVVVPVVAAVVGLVVGIPAYLGLWRSWTGVDGNKAWALGFLWIGIGGTVVLIGSVLPTDSAAGSWVSAAGAVIGVLGTCSCDWMPPFLRPRWYRAQYRPLLPRRRS